MALAARKCSSAWASPPKTVACATAAAVAPVAIAATSRRPVVAPGAAVSRWRRLRSFVCGGGAVPAIPRTGVRGNLGGGHQQSQRHQVVGVVEIIELRSVYYLQVGVEGARVSRSQLAQVAKLVEGEDICDVVGWWAVRPPTPSVASPALEGER